MIKFMCKSCGQKFNLEDKYSGKKVKCPKCGTVGIISNNSDKITFQCESCGQKISVSKSHAGKKGKCPKCSNPILVPSIRKETPNDTKTFSVVCSMCDKSLQVPETSRGKIMECPGCGSYIETSSGDDLYESNTSIPSTTAEDSYEDDSEEYYYFVLPLPKDNPDEHAPVLMSSANDDYKTLGINEGEYYIEIDGTNGLGLCTNEEELEILYRALTRTEIEK